MSERLTWEQIKVAYPDQWVVLTDMVAGTWGRKGGRVVGHGATRYDADTSWRLGGELHECTGVYFTGKEVPDNFVVFLGKFDILKNRI